MRALVWLSTQPVTHWLEPNGVGLGTKAYANAVLDSWRNATHHASDAMASPFYHLPFFVLTYPWHVLHGVFGQLLTAVQHRLTLSALQADVGVGLCVCVGIVLVSVTVASVREFLIDAQVIGGGGGGAGAAAAEAVAGEVGAAGLVGGNNNQANNAVVAGPDADLGANAADGEDGMSPLLR